MPGKWILEVEPNPSASSGYILRIQVKDSQTGNRTEVLSCRSIGELEEQVASFKSEMDELLRGAREKVKSLEGAGPKGVHPEKVWQEMERCPSEEDMFVYFNSLDMKTRQKVAEYILTTVSMFRGRGPVFSEHYDSTSHTLE